MNQGLPNRKPRAIAVRITADNRKASVNALIIAAAAAAAAITEAGWLVYGLLHQ